MEKIFLSRPILRSPRNEQVDVALPRVIADELGDTTIAKLMDSFKRAESVDKDVKGRPWKQSPTEIKSDYGLASVRGEPSRSGPDSEAVEGLFQCKREMCIV